MRARLVALTGGADRIELEGKIMDQGKLQLAAQENITNSQYQVDDQTKQATQNRAEADTLDQQARDAEGRGDARGAEELREQATKQRAIADVNAGLAARSKGDIDRYQHDLDSARTAQKELQTQDDAQTAQRTAAEQAVDGLEDRVRALRDANAEGVRADGLDKEAADLRAQGDTAGADAKALEATTARMSADAAKLQADAIYVDQDTLKPLEGVAVPTPSTPTPSTQAPAAPTARSDGAPPIDTTPPADTAPAGTTSATDTTPVPDATSAAATTSVSDTSADVLTGAAPAAITDIGATSDPAAQLDTGATTTPADDTIGDLTPAANDPGFTPDVGAADPAASDPGFTPDVGTADTPVLSDPGFTPDTGTTDPADADPGFTPPAAATDTPDLTANDDMTPATDTSTDDGF